MTYKKKKVNWQPPPLLFLAIAPGDRGVQGGVGAGCVIVIILRVDMDSRWRLGTAQEDTGGKLMRDISELSAARQSGGALSVEVRCKAVQDLLEVTGDVRQDDITEGGGASKLQRQVNNGRIAAEAERGVSK